MASANNDRVLRYDGRTGAFIDVFIQNGVNGLPANDLDYPVDLTYGPDGALYVSSQLNDSILRFNATTGAFLGTFIPSGTGGLDGPSGIGFFNGDLFVAGRFSSRAYCYDGTTGAFELEIGAARHSDWISAPTETSMSPAAQTTGLSASTPRPAQTSATSSPQEAANCRRPSALSSAQMPISMSPVFNTGIIERYNGTTGAPISDFVVAGSGGLEQPNFITFAVPEPGITSVLVGLLCIASGRRQRAFSFIKSAPM